MPFDYAGCLHIHTTASDGSGHLIDVIEAAQAADLDWILISDHETMKWRRLGGEGWYGSTFVMIGQEMGREEGHYLGVGLQRNIPTRNGKSKRLLRRIEGQDPALPSGAIVLHPDGPSKPSFGIREHRWKARRLRAIMGMEVWSYMYDWLRDLNWFNFPYYYLLPHRAIAGPSREALQMWDRLGQKTHITGIGGLDVHRKQPWPFNWGSVFDYEPLFRTLRTHLLSPEPWTGDAARDRRLIASLLTQGRCYFANDSLHPARGFSFHLETPDGRIEMGEETEIPASGRFHVHLPRIAEIRLVWNGKVLTATVDSRLSYPMPAQPIPDSQGVYRVEARTTRGHPWIFSNPIYLRAASSRDERQRAELARVREG